MDLNKLKSIMPFKWRVQSHYESNGKNYVRLVAYVDSRDVAEKLDNVVGIGHWQDEYYQVKNTLFCRIGIKIGDEWVWKSDAGMQTKVEKEKGESSDAFKRAAVKWGINRAAYRVGLVTLPAKKYGNNWYPCDNRGGFLKGEKLYELCNKMAKVEEMESFDIEFDAETQRIIDFIHRAKSLKDLEQITDEMQLDDDVALAYTNKVNELK